MKLIFATEAWEDYVHWCRYDKTMVARINTMIDRIVADPSSDYGKPEVLTHALAGFQSRRLTAEHRIVYRVDSGQLLVAQLGYWH